MTIPHLPASVSRWGRAETYRSRRHGSIYEPIPEGEYIRLLQLRPGRDGDDIDCSLSIVDIASAKATYEAISYVWGDPNETIDIHCNGLRVAITISLANALRNFRHISEPRVLWADALCINQKDNREKGHQVKRMGEVYANARCTLVWLGCDDQNIAGDVFSLILDANAYFSSSFFTAGQNVYTMAPFIRPYPICMYAEKWLGVARFFNFPWFRRVWTVQEAAIAKVCRMFWGPLDINIAEVLEICVWISKRQDFRNAILNVIGPIHRLDLRRINLYLQYNTHQPEIWHNSPVGLAHLATHFKEKAFWMILRAARYLEASDPRDHIYAFLGCPAAIDSEGHTLVEANYEISVEELNCLLAYALMGNAAEGPFALSFVLHDSRAALLNNMHPSWVPGWHCSSEVRMSIADPSYWFQAGGTRQLFTATQYSENRLRVGACSFDTVIWTSNRIRLDQAGSKPTYASASGSNGVLIDTLWDDLMQSSSQLGITVRQVDFLRSLMMGYPSQGGFSDISDERQQRMIDSYRKSLGVARLDDMNPVVMPADERNDAAYVGIILENLRNVSMFLTGNGRIGIAPLGDLVRVGDSCCIIFGVTVPFLLTPAKEGRNKLIGECYINGVMNGEIMQRFAGSNLSEHHIVLE